jgi:hypothetical protein
MILTSTSPAAFEIHHRLTKRSSQPLAGAVNHFNFMKEFSMFAMLALASGG